MKGLQSGRAIAASPATQSTPAGRLSMLFGNGKSSTCGNCGAPHEGDENCRYCGAVGAFVGTPGLVEAGIVTPEQALRLLDVDAVCAVNVAATAEIAARLDALKGKP